MTAQRIIVPGATTAVTRRCNLRKAFLAPWDPRVTQSRLFALADAQRETDVAVHHDVAVINHYHCNVTPRAANLPEFVGRVNHDTSCALNTLLANERYDSPRQLFDDREPHYLRLMDASAQAGHLLYEHLNTAAAGLVDRPEHMPGFTFDFGLWKSGGLWVQRPDFYFDQRRPERIFLRVTPPPLLLLAFGGDVDALVHHMRQLVEDGIRKLRCARTRPVVGARDVRRIHPWSEPKTLRESGGTDTRTFKFGARDLLGRKHDRQGSLEVSGFRERHSEVRRIRLAGDLEARFPFGTYAMRVRHGAPVEPEPPLDALVARPGPTLEDVHAMLDQERPERDQVRTSAHRVVDQVREAFAEQAQDIVEEDALELTRMSPASVTTDAKDRTGPDDIVDVRHRFHAGPRARAGDARRVVVLRDRRRGRPSKRASESKHGSDPPS